MNSKWELYYQKMKGEYIVDLSERRKEIRLTQEALAKILEVDRSSISKWENKETIPSINMLKKLAIVFCCTIDELLKD